MTIFKCVKTLVMEDSKEVAFTKDEIYQRTKPEVWPPDRTIKYCLIDNLKNEHFFTPKCLNEHFERVGGG